MATKRPIELPDTAVHVGQYNLRLYTVDLWASPVPRSGGVSNSFSLWNSGKVSTPTSFLMHVSVQADWAETFEAVLHEAFESLMQGLGTGYSPSFAPNTSTGRYLYVLEHEVYTDICTSVSRFMVSALSGVHDLWLKWFNTRSKK